MGKADLLGWSNVSWPYDKSVFPLGLSSIRTKRMKSITVIDFILISIIVLLLEISNVARVLLELWHLSLPLFLYFGWWTIVSAFLW